jgi:hypothetical protein
MIVAPLCLLVLLGLARLINRHRSRPAGPHPSLVRPDVIAFAAAFVVAFTAPVLPIPLRSELYLYLPVFGVCLFAGWLSRLLVSRIERRPLVIALGLYVAGLGGYQVARSMDIHRDLAFSEKLVSGLRGWANSEGVLVLVPSDDVTERFLRDAVGGYFSFVVQRATRNPRVTGAVQYRRDPARQGDLRLSCTYRQGVPSLIISPAPIIQ